MPWRWLVGVIAVLISGVQWAPIAITPVSASDAVAPPERPASASTAAHPDRPKLGVVPRTKGLRNYPCSICHQFVTPNPEPRALSTSHPSLEHGSGEFWCGACHNMQTPDKLSSATLNDVAFDDAHLVCGQCHASQLEDWQYGSHSRRVDYWQGHPELYGCVHCHDPHAPAIKPRKPQPPPPVRAGLARPENRIGDPARAVWERYARPTVERQQEGAQSQDNRTPLVGAFSHLTATEDRANDK